jgi:hypothetical protein
MFLYFPSKNVTLPFVSVKKMVSFPHPKRNAALHPAPGVALLRHRLRLVFQVAAQPGLWQSTAGLMCIKKQMYLLKDV